MLCAADRSTVASGPVFGLLNAYALTLGIDATETVGDCSVCGVSTVVFHASSGLAGGGSVARYFPTQPGPWVFNGFAVDQMSVPWKWERLELAYPARWINARRP